MLHSTKTKFTSEEKVLVECDFKVSSKCKGKYLKLYKNILKCRNNNNGKDRCCFCFNSITKIGSQNYNFKYKKNDKFFEGEIKNELQSYLLGFIAGDGSLKKDGFYLSVNKKDLYIIKLFKRSLKSELPIFYRKYDNTYNLKVHSIKLVRDICKHLKINIGKKYDKIVLPDLNNNLMWHFIRGLIDSDGHIGCTNGVTTNPFCSYRSASKKIKLQLVEFLNQYNIKTFLYDDRNNLSWSGYNALNFMNKMYENSNFFLKRKKDRYDIWKTWKPFEGIKGRPSKRCIKNKRKKI